MVGGLELIGRRVVSCHQQSGAIAPTLSLFRVGIPACRLFFFPLVRSAYVVHNQAASFYPSFVPSAWLVIVPL